jgi:hypothetical protein
LQCTSYAFSFIFQFLATIAVILFLGLAITKPMVALSLVITQFVLEQILQSYYSFFVTQNSAFNILVAIIATLSLTRLLTKAGTQIKIWNLATILTLFYFCFAAISTLWSPNTQVDNLITATLAYIIIYILIGPVLINSMIDAEIKEPNKCFEWMWADIHNLPNPLFLCIKNYTLNRNL